MSEECKIVNCSLHDLFNCARYKVGRAEREYSIKIQCNFVVDLVDVNNMTILETLLYNSRQALCTNQSCPVYH